MAIVCGNDMYIAHLGDSRIAIGRQSAKGIEADVLTRDHKPSLPRELVRIHKAGGKVQKKSGVDRVVWTRTKNDHQGPVRRTTAKYEIPFLAVSRSLGDLWSYNFDSHEYIVSPDPEIWHHTIDASRDRFLILASDGLWNVASVYDCVHIVDKYSAQRSNNSNGLMKETISHKLVKRGMDLWNYRMLRADNITVVTCFFEEPDRLGDEEDQLDIDSVRDWSNVGLELRGPYPEGASPLKPPLRRRLACPKLSSLENYNVCFCQSHKEKRRYSGSFVHWSSQRDGALPWMPGYRQDMQKVKTCDCSQLKNGIGEIKARAKQSGEKITTSKIMCARSYSVSKKPPAKEEKIDGKILYPRPYVSCRKRPHSEPEREVAIMKKLKVEDRRRDSTQALSPPERSSKEPGASDSTLAGAMCVYSPLSAAPRPSPSSPASMNSANAENEGMAPSPRRRNLIRRSPRIQAAALTIPRRRRSCTIR